MLIGMPSSQMARSVPWSRLKPRRKYWLALPSPECWVTIRPGTASSISPGRSIGRVLSVSPDTRCSDAASVGSASRARGEVTVMAGRTTDAPVGMLGGGLAGAAAGGAVCARASPEAASTSARDRKCRVCILISIVHTPWCDATMECAGRLFVPRNGCARTIAAASRSLDALAFGRHSRQMDRTPPLTGPRLSALAAALFAITLNFLQPLVHAAMMRDGAPREIVECLLQRDGRRSGRQASARSGSRAGPRMLPRAGPCRCADGAVAGLRRSSAPRRGARAVPAGRALTSPVGIRDGPRRPRGPPSIV